MSDTPNAACPAGRVSPRANSAISEGTAASNPTTSSMPPSDGSAMLNLVAVMPTTISFAAMPERCRYLSEHLTPATNQLNALLG